MLHPEQVTTQKQPWDRMDGEPPRWFQRFTRYRLMGRQRSLQACIEQEQEYAQQDTTSHKNNKKTFPLATLPQPPGADMSAPAPDLKAVRPGVPGNWKNASVKWRWVERAEAWDLAQYEEWHTKLVKDVYLEAEFADRAYRIWVLNAYADLLQKIILQTFADDPNVKMKEKLAAIKLSQSLLKDIRKEMDKLESPFSL
jgi:hypothetical protein